MELKATEREGIRITPTRTEWKRLQQPSREMFQPTEVTLLPVRSIGCWTHVVITYGFQSVIDFDIIMVFVRGTVVLEGYEAQVVVVFFPNRLFSFLLNNSPCSSY